MRTDIRVIASVIFILLLLGFADKVKPDTLMNIAEATGFVYIAENKPSNNDVFLKYPSDGTAFNEIHRYYGDCRIFGDVAAACYDAGYGRITKLILSRKLNTKYFVLSQGQIDVCNMMYNKAVYDAYMEKERESTTKIFKEFGLICQLAIDSINKEQFNRDYQGKTDEGKE